MAEPDTRNPEEIVDDFERLERRQEHFKNLCAPGQTRTQLEYVVRDLILVTVRQQRKIDNLTAAFKTMVRG